MYRIFIAKIYFGKLSSSHFATIYSVFKLHHTGNKSATDIVTGHVMPVHKHVTHFQTTVTTMAEIFFSSDSFFAVTLVHRIDTFLQRQPLTILQTGVNNTYIH